MQTNRTAPPGMNLSFKGGAFHILNTYSGTIYIGSSFEVQTNAKDTGLIVLLIVLTGNIKSKFILGGSYAYYWLYWKREKH